MTRSRSAAYGARPTTALRAPGLDWLLLAAVAALLVLGSLLVWSATSTRDDRVHPGHARKMAARLGSLGKDVTYWENVEGGHGGAADAGQQATMQALLYVFLRRQLGLDGGGAVGHTSA